MTHPPSPAPDPPHAQPCDLDLLTQFSAGELDAAHRDLISAHLIDCERCWHELDTQRVASSAVHTLWEPAPVGLRADIRAAISAAQPQPRHNLRRIVFVAAAVIAALSMGGVVANWPTSTTHHRHIAATAPIPAPIQAAITQAGTTPPAHAVPPAPRLGAAGLRLTASGATNAGGFTAAQYTYTDRAGHRVTVFVAARTWPRPAPATTLSSRTWLISPTTPTALTVVGGPDRTGENMLVIASDHTAAMTAAAQLGLL